MPNRARELPDRDGLLDEIAGLLQTRSIRSACVSDLIILATILARLDVRGSVVSSEIKRVGLRLV